MKFQHGPNVAISCLYIHMFPLEYIITRYVLYLSYVGNVEKQLILLWCLACVFISCRFNISISYIGYLWITLNIIKLTLTLICKENPYVRWKITINQDFPRMIFLQFILSFLSIFPIGDILGSFDFETRGIKDTGRKMIKKYNLWLWKHF